MSSPKRHNIKLRHRDCKERDGFFHIKNYFPIIASFIHEKSIEKTPVSCVIDGGDGFQIKTINFTQVNEEINKGGSKDKESHQSNKLNFFGGLKSVLYLFRRRRKNKKDMVDLFLYLLLFLLDSFCVIMWYRRR